MLLPAHEKGRRFTMKVLRAHDYVAEQLTEDHPYRLMTISEVARELRCSKGHVQNLIHGKVRHTLPLPSIALGRRRMVRLSSLHEWIRANEQIHRKVRYDPSGSVCIAEGARKD
jgi:excisionase family DNA binding protein